MTERPKLTRFTRSPEFIELDGEIADHTHLRAVAFSLINEKVLTTGRTHPFIFNALTTLVLPERSNEIACASLARSGREAFLGDYSVGVWPSPLTEDDLRWFRARHTGDMGKMRERTKSGRVWLEAGRRGGRVTVFSFWVTSGMVPDGALRLLRDRFNLNGPSPIYVEFLDSLHPLLFSLG